ncbi:RloB family protein [Micromonospora sp. CA-263727]|uniref:RloB family protein n=1 Tax=Micromonospora sp. CA-263727 TaxID=3239967 RepID=UPI003D911CDB
MPRRENHGGRRRPVLDRRYTVLVFCGAARTEPAYLDGLKRVTRSSGLTVKIRQDGVAPDALVRAAAGYRARHPGVFDEVWCVVDVDDFDIESAAVEARRRNVHLAVSNPCFELWLLLHHADCRSYCAGYPDVANRLKRYVPAYDKTRLDFADFAPGLAGALARAEELDPTGSDHRRNPSSGMWRLVGRILEKR